MNSVINGALTGRLASRYSATDQTNRRDGNLDGTHSPVVLKPRSTPPSSVHATPDLLRFAAGFRTPVQCLVICSWTHQFEVFSRTAVSYTHLTLPTIYS